MGPGQLVLRVLQDAAGIRPNHLRNRSHHPEKLRGPTTLGNLALACFHCNNHKGPNIGGIDQETGEKAFFYNPRTDTRHEHFVWQGAIRSAHRLAAGHGYGRRSPSRGTVLDDGASLGLQEGNDVPCLNIRLVLGLFSIRKLAFVRLC